MVAADCWGYRIPSGLRAWYGRLVWGVLMDRQDIIRMAREAGLLVIGTADGGNAVYTWPQGITDELERFAALVSKHEREACAAVCDVLAVHPEYASDITKVAAQAIRARGNT